MIYLPLPHELTIDACGLCDGYVADYGPHTVEDRDPLRAAHRVLVRAITEQTTFRDETRGTDAPLFGASHD